jgi:thiol-disulfide isomerase/thioredoxin
VLARHNEVTVRVNGKETLVQKVSPDRISGNGIIFQTGGGWRGWDKTPNTVEFSDFSIDRSSGFLPKRIINQNAKKHALTVPRFHRDEPPTHVLVASNGDLLRGRLVSARGDTINFLSRGEEFELSRSRVSAIIWLQSPAEATSPDGENTVEEDFLPFQSTHQFVLHDGTRLNLVGEGVDKEKSIFVGESNKLGKCRIPLHSISDQTYGVDHVLAQKIHADQLAYSDWKVEFTPDPAIPKGDGSGNSPMIGKDAPDFSIEQLDGRQFNLAHLKGRVVVLDFWATWCGPCIRAMPEVIQAVQLFRGQPVSFCAINQAETPPIINEFLELRGWEGIPVGLDYQLNTSRDYEVKGIPHTVVIGKDGKIAWVHTGYSPDLKKKLVGAVSRALQQNPAP